LVDTRPGCFPPDIYQRSGADERCKNAEETAALASVLRLLANYPVAIQVAGQWGDHPQSMLQMALCQIETGSDKALETARRVVELQPSDPMSYILMAKQLKKRMTCRWRWKPWKQASACGRTNRNGTPGQPNWR
jgi:hypothetical protein